MYLSERYTNGNPEEANHFPEDGFLRTVSRPVQTVIGCAMLFDRRDGNVSGMEMMRWIIPAMDTVANVLRDKDPGLRKF